MRIPEFAGQGYNVTSKAFPMLCAPFPPSQILKAIPKHPSWTVLRQYTIWKAEHTQPKSRDTKKMQIIRCRKPD